jgi:hypothetical protein
LTTLKEFEEALREQGMHMALAILQKLRDRDRTKRSVTPARRIAGKKMTPELARHILELHGTTEMTQQEIAFQLGVNQGRVNEVIKRGKWLNDNPAAPEAIARDKAKARMAGSVNPKRAENREIRAIASRDKKRPSPKAGSQTQLLLGDL